MKKIVFSSVVVALIMLTGCLKDDTIRSGLDAVTNTVLIEQSGLANFKSAAIVTAGQVDTIENTFIVNYANADGVPLTSNLKVTVGVDDSKRIAYNAVPITPTSSHLFYDLLPDSTYTINPVGTILAGKNTVTFVLKVDPNKVDPSKLYMLALTIKDAQGKTIASNFSTVYYHIIGNPLAGNYTMTGARYNFTGQNSWPGPPVPIPGTITTPYSGTILATPVDALTVNLTMGNVPEPSPGTGGAQYYVSALNNTFANITYDNGSNFDAGYSNAVRYIINYNFVGTGTVVSPKPTFHLITKYNNAPGGAGNDRIIDQTFTKQ